MKGICINASYSRFVQGKIYEIEIQTGTKYVIVEGFGGGWDTKRFILLDKCLITRYNTILNHIPNKPW